MALAFFLFGCRTELSDNFDSNISQSDYRKTVKLKEALAFKNYLTEVKSNPSQVYGKNADCFSALSDESTVTVIVQNNVTSYSTVIRHLDRSSDVLVYSIDNENESIGFTAKYTPEDRTKNYQIDNFTGTVEFTAMDGKPMGVKELSNGTPLPDKVTVSKNSMNKAGDCSFSIRLIEVECNGEHHSPSQIAQCTASQKPYYIVEITEVCSGGGQPPKGFPNMGTYDGGGSSGDNSTTNEMSIPDSFNYMLGGAGFPELTPDEYAYIQNNQYIGGQLLSYFYNNLNQNNSQFLHWSINYFKNYVDPNISPNAAYKQFQNWFLEEPISGSLQNELFEDWGDPTRVKSTTKFKKQVKINTVYNKVKKAANFKQYLQNFEPTFSVAHLLFDIGTCEKTDALAETSSPESYWIKIVFNKDKDWVNIPKVVIANTFMHEMIHAEMLRKLLSVSSTPNGSIDWNIVNSLNTSHNYPGLFDYYVRCINGDTNYQHEAMAAHYVNIMVNFLKQVYGTTYTNTEYKTIVWMSSLMGTKAWNLLPQAEKTLYINTWNTNYWLWEI